MTFEEFLNDNTQSREIFDALAGAIDAAGPSTRRTGKSQVAFSRKRAFAWAWAPRMYLRSEAAPLVLTLALDYRDPSARWKQVVESAPGRFMHHLELGAPEDIDFEVAGWVTKAWTLAGP